MAWIDDLRRLSINDLIPLGQWAAAELQRGDPLPKATLEKCIAIKNEFILRVKLELWRELWNR